MIEELDVLSPEKICRVMIILAPPKTDYSPVISLP